MTYRSYRNPFTQSWIWSQIDMREEAECWPWLGTYFSDGYGRIREHHAHRVVWSLTYGYMPEPSMPIRHTCDNPKCCNPSHLEIGTQLDNVRDCIERGRRRYVGHDQRGERNGNARLSAAQIAQIRALYEAGGIRQVDLAAQFGIRQTQVSRIVRGEQWATP